MMGVELRMWVVGLCVCVCERERIVLLLLLTSLLLTSLLLLSGERRRRGAVARRGAAFSASKCEGRERGGRNITLTNQRRLRLCRL